MAQRKFELQNTNYALQHAVDAVHLIEQKGRLEKAVLDEDAPLVLDTAKTLLESIFKTVLVDRLETPNLDQDFKPLYRNVRDEVPFNDNDEANSILGKLGGAIVHNVAELRNRFGAASHGDDGYFETPIQMNDAEMVAHVVDGLAGFVYRKHKHKNDPELAQRLYYSDYPEFNNFIDGQYPSYQFVLGESAGINILPSNIIFQSDQDVYREMLLQFRDTEEFDEIKNEEVSVNDVHPTKDNLRANHNLLETDIDTDEVEINVSHILFQYDANQTDREELNELGMRISKGINDLRVVDWYKRESTIAAIRSFLRVSLRRGKFPKDKRQYVIPDVVDYLMSQDNPKETPPEE